MNCSVLLVDDSVLVRKALTRLINEIDGVSVTNEAGDLNEALSIVENYRPSLIICELALPGPSGIELLYELHRRKAKVPFLALTRNSSADTARQAVRAGADGYLTKNASEDELRTAITMLHRGGSYFCRQFGTTLGAVEHDGSDPLGLLSSREREIFHLLANGMQNSSIARQLSISPRTVETHRARIVQKLGIHSNAELIHFAVGSGLAIP